MRIEAELIKKTHYKIHKIITVFCLLGAISMYGQDNNYTISHDDKDRLHSFSDTFINLGFMKGHPSTLNSSDTSVKVSLVHERFKIKYLKSFIGINLDKSLGPLLTYEDSTFRLDSLLHFSSIQDEFTNKYLAPNLTKMTLWFYRFPIHVTWKKLTVSVIEFMSDSITYSIELRKDNISSIFIYSTDYRIFIDYSKNRIRGISYYNYFSGYGLTYYFNHKTTPKIIQITYYTSLPSETIRNERQLYTYKRNGRLKRRWR